VPAPPGQHGSKELPSEMVQQAPAAVRVDAAPGGARPHVVQLPVEDAHGLWEQVGASWGRQVARVGWCRQVGRFPSFSCQWSGSGKKTWGEGRGRRQGSEDQR